MKSMRIEMDCVLLNMQLAVRHVSKKNLELAVIRIVDARKSLEELEKLIKKAN